MADLCSAQIASALHLAEVEMTMRVGPAKPKTSRSAATDPSAVVAKPSQKTPDEIQNARHLTATTIEKGSGRQSKFAAGVSEIDARSMPVLDPTLRPRTPQIARGLRNEPPIDSPVNPSGLDTRQQRAVDQAVSAINQSGAEIAQAEGKDAQRQATVDASRTLEAQLAGQDPAVQTAILEQTQGSISAIASHLGQLDGQQTQQAVGHLTRATESVGRDRASQITDAIAPHLNQSLQSHRNDTREFGSAIFGSIKDGDGALFGASLTLSLQAAGEGNLAAMTATTTSIGIDSVRKDYQEAQNRADQLDGQLAMVAKDWSGNFGEEAVRQGIQSYRDAHGADYDSAATQAQRLSSTLAGAGLIQDSRAQLSQLPKSFSMSPHSQSFDPNQTQASRAADQVFAQLPRLGQTAAGSEAINAAVGRQAEGEPTFLNAATSYGQRLEGNEQLRYQEGLNTAMGRAATLGAEQLAAAGRTTEIPQLMSRYSEATGSAEFKRVFAELGAESQQLVNQGFDAAEFSIAFAGASRKVANRLYPANNPANRAMRGRINAMGAGIASAAFINDPSIRSGVNLGQSWAQARFGSSSRVGKYLKGAGVAFDAVDFAKDPNVENGLGLIGSTAGLGASLTRAWRGVSGLRGVAAGTLGKASLVTGLALSAWDTYGALQRGDAVGAAAAAAPAVGAGIGAAIGLVGGVGIGAAPGAALGYAVGSVVQLGISAGQKLFGTTPQEAFEKSTESFLQGALRAEGLDPSLAARLRDVGGEAGAFAGVGRTITEIAENHGYAGVDVLRALERLPDGQREDQVKVLLRFPTNAEAIAEIREQGAAGAEVPDFAITGESDRGVFFRSISQEQFLRDIDLQSSAAGGSW